MIIRGRLRGGAAHHYCGALVHDVTAGALLSARWRMRRRPRRSRTRRSARDAARIFPRRWRKRAPWQTARYSRGIGRKHCQRHGRPAACPQHWMWLRPLRVSHGSHKAWHERMRLGVRIFERLLRQPCIVGLADIGRKTFDVEIRQFLVPGLLRREHLHEHRGVNCGRLHPLQSQKSGAPLQRVIFIHQPIAPAGPVRRFVGTPRRADRRQRHQHGGDRARPISFLGNA